MLIALLLLSTAAHADSWNGRIVRASDGAAVTLTELATGLGPARHVVLGEKHYTAAVQQAQARVIEAVAAADPGPFTTAWEFINFSDQARNAGAFASFAAGKIDGKALLAQLGNANAETYLPIFETTARLGGQLLGVNLSREQKAPVVQHGIAGADPTVVPPGFAMGGDLYRERFYAVMSDGHASQDQLGNYFAAQCLTDDVMAYHVVNDSGAARDFLVTGSFHADYHDAAVARIVERAPGETTRVVRFVDASDYAQAELAGLVRDARYGELADFVFYVNEPSK